MLETLSEWPTPPYFQFEDKGAKPDAEDCLIYYNDGKKALGQLIRIYPDESKLEFLSSKNDDKEIINMEQIKVIRLLRPLVMRRQLALLEQRADELVHSLERQTYTVEFLDKQVINGETIGYAETSNGLYLYFPKDKTQVMRCYIPKSSMSRFQIGLHLGEMLLRENLVQREHIDQAVAHQRKLRHQRIGEYLSEQEIVSREQLDKAIAHQESRPIMKLGEALQELGLISQEQLQSALVEQQKNRKKPLGQILVDMGFVEATALREALAKKLGIPFVGLDKFHVDSKVIPLVTAAQAKNMD